MINPNLNYGSIPPRLSGLRLLFQSLTNSLTKQSLDLSSFANDNKLKMVDSNETSKLLPLSVSSSGAIYSTSNGVQFDDGSTLYFISYNMQTKTSSATSQLRWYGVISFDVPKSYAYTMALQRKYASYDYINRQRVSNTAELTLEGDFSKTFIVMTDQTDPKQALEFLTPDVMYAITDTTLMTSCEVFGNKVSVLCNVLGQDRESIKKFISYYAELQQKIIY